MQIEGFWYYLLTGVFEAATIHYAVAKIFGPLLFGRGWCGYACWTAMVLDFLPYKQPQKPRGEKLGVLRYVMFVLSLALVSGLFLMKVAHFGANHVLGCPRRKLRSITLRALRWPLSSRITGRSASICVLWALSTVSLIRWRCTDIRSMRAHVPNVENARRPARWISRYGRSRTAWNVSLRRLREGVSYAGNQQKKRRLP